MFASNAQQEILELSEQLRIPVITTMMGISVFPDDDPLYMGMIGTHGVTPANRAVNACDTLFLVGARVGDRAVKTPLALEKTTKILHIDIDPAEIGKNIGADYPLVGDAKLVLGQMLDHIKEKPMDIKASRQQWLDELDSYREKIKFKRPVRGTVNPKEFIEKLSERLPENVNICADVGQNQIWASRYKFKKGGRFLTSGGMGTMGYSLPCAIGARMADETRPTFAICGDGGFQMNLMELATAMQYGVDVKVIVMTNTRLGMVRELQTNGYNDRQTAVFLDGSPDFVKLAAAYGIPAVRVTSNKSAEKAIEELATHKGTMLCEVVVDKDFPTL